LREICRVGNVDVYLQEDASAHWTSAVEYFLTLQGSNLAGQHQLRSGVSLRLHSLESSPQAARQTPGLDPNPSGTARIFSYPPFELAVKPAEGGLDIWCGPKRKFFSLPFMAHLAALASGGTLIHSAGLEVDGRAILVAGFGGVGKTAFVAKGLAAPGVKLLGDDLLAVDDSGLINGYLRPFAIYPYHQPLFDLTGLVSPFAFNPLTSLPMKALYRMGNYLGQKFDWKYWRLPTKMVQAGYLRIPPQELFSMDKMALGPVPLKAVYILSRSDAIDKLEVREIAPNSAANFMAAVMFHELHRFARPLIAWQIFRGQSMSEYFAQIENTLEAMLSQADGVYSVRLPLDMAIETVGEQMAHIALAQS
jgi:hypothetical protein